MAQFYRRVVAVGAEGVETLYEERRRKRKVSRVLRPLEKATRRNLEASKTFGEEMLRRHNRSSRKRRDGWMRDLGLNTMRSQAKAVKKLY